MSDTDFGSLGLSTTGLGGNGGLETNGDNNPAGNEGMTGDSNPLGSEGMTGDDGMMGDGTDATGLEMMEPPSFCSDELLEPGLTVGSGSVSSLNL